jgi:hypothetical protein
MAIIAISIICFIFILCENWRNIILRRYENLENTRLTSMPDFSDGQPTCPKDYRLLVL